MNKALNILKKVQKSLFVFLLAGVVLTASACGKSSITADDIIGKSSETSVISTEEAETASKETQAETVSVPSMAETRSETAETEPEQTTASEQPQTEMPSADSAPAEAPAQQSGWYEEPQAQTTEAYIQPETEWAMPETDAPVIEDVTTAPQTEAQETFPETEPEAESEPAYYSCSVTVDAGGSEGVYFSGSITFTGVMTVYDLLVETGVSLDVKGNYIRAINGLAEKEHGPMSGWLYQVNGVTPMKASNAYYVNDGDEIYWFYQYDD